MSQAYFISGRRAAVRRHLDSVSFCKILCACGAEKEHGYVICKACWLAAPVAIRSQYQSLGTRREGTKALHKFAASRKNISRDGCEGSEVKGDCCTALPPSQPSRPSQDTSEETR